MLLCVGDLRIAQPCTLNHAFSIGSSLPKSVHICQVSHWIQIPLECSNMYLFWKAQMENLLWIHHLSNIVSSSQVIPSWKDIDGLTNQSYDVWLEKNWRVLGWIQAAVSPPMFLLVMNQHSP